VNEDATRSTHSRLNRTADDEQLAEELTRIHEEVAGANKSANSRPLQILPDRLRDSGDGSADQLSSARRVMELLAAMRPGNNADQTMLDVDDETRSEEVGKTGSVQASNLEIPATIGRFEIRELLGHGGFGMVFRAHDHRLDRDVALKIPTANSLLNSESRQRFERECRAVASLNHPNIVPVFEVGSDGPVDYLASELVEGTDLANWVRTNGVSDALKTAQAMVKVAEAVQHAHSRGVVHRDLKPSNILLEAKNGLHLQMSIH